MDQLTNQPVRLHLGCGEQYLEGYQNIDFPQSEHSVMKPKADKFADIRTLSYEPGSVAEIRSHHVFEHFSRGETLKLLRQWHGWLMEGGKLIIETPDFEGSARKFLSADLYTQGQLLRHIFGSQEAKWALHLDGWYGKKFRFVLREFGFDHVRVEKFSNRLSQKIAQKIEKNIPGLRTVLNIAGNLVPQFVYRKRGGHKMPNIVATAIKTNNAVDFEAAARRVLSMGLVGGENEAMLAVWMKEAGF